MLNDMRLEDYTYWVHFARKRTPFEKNIQYHIMDTLEKSTYTLFVST